jgi:hypothetical protein
MLCFPRAPPPPPSFDILGAVLCSATLPTATVLTFRPAKFPMNTNNC